MHNDIEIIILCSYMHCKCYKYRLSKFEDNNSFNFQRTQTSFQMACLHVSKRSSFLEGRILSSQSNQIEKLSKSCDLLEKRRPSKNYFAFGHANSWLILALWFTDCQLTER